MNIEHPSDLPPEFREKVRALAARYRRTHLWNSDSEADAAAFRDVRDEFWRGMNRHGNPTTPQTANNLT
jgi:hypothetical protein